MDFSLLRIHYQNIRDFRNLTIDFTKDGDPTQPHHVSLVQMPNGTGKTTTITLLRRVFPGSGFEEDEVYSYRPTNFPADEGIFEVEAAYDGTPFTLRLEFNYDTGEYRYHNSKPKMEGGGLEEGHWLPSEIRHIFSPSFVRLFIFDGELSKQLLKTGAAHAEAAIKSIYFLDRLEGRKQDIEEIEEDRYQSASETSAHTEQGLKNLNSRLQTVKGTLEELQEQRDELEASIKREQKQIAQLEEERQSILSEREEVLEEFNDLEHEIKEERQAIKEKTLAVLDHLRKPRYFSRGIHEDIQRLFDQMEVLKLPKPTSAEFFRDLTERSSCICNRPMTDEARQAILEGSEKYLSEEDISVLNAMKDQLRNLPEFEPVAPLFEEINESHRELRKKRQRRDGLQNQLDPNSRQRVKELDNEIQERQTDLKNRRAVLDMITTTDRSHRDQLGLGWEDNIPLCNQRVKELKAKIQEATDTVEFGKKADKLNEIIEDVVNRSLKTLEIQVRDTTNERLERILQSDEVQISHVDYSINIEDKENVSEGQSLSVGYAFLSTLFEEGPLNVPFIVDSPAVSADLQVRREVADMVPNLFEQMIVFIISSERDGFVEGLHPSGSTQYYTVFKTDDGKNIKKSMDRDFFMDFQSEEER